MRSLCFLFGILGLFFVLNRVKTNPHLAHGLNLRCCHLFLFPFASFPTIDVDIPQSRPRASSGTSLGASSGYQSEEDPDESGEFHF